MRVLTTKILPIFLLATASLYAQDDKDPVSLNQKFFSGQIKNYKSILTGEARKQNFNPFNITKGAKIEYEVLSVGDDKRVIATSITEDRTLDLYVFWENKSGWKITSFRALWLPPLFFQALDQYKQADDEGLKKEYATRQEKSKTLPDSLKTIGLHETVDDFLFEAKNMRLIIASDKDLAAHFSKNKNIFDSIRLVVQASLKATGEFVKPDIHSPLKKSLEQILISSVSCDRETNIITFLIGGMIDNTVGYFYCERRENVPKMSAERMIMVRTLGGGWFLFKTT